MNLKEVCLIGFVTVFCVTCLVMFVDILLKVG